MTCEILHDIYNKARCPQGKQNVITYVPLKASPPFLFLLLCFLNVIVTLMLSSPLALPRGGFTYAEACRVFQWNIPSQHIASAHIVENKCKK